MICGVTRHEVWIAGPVEIHVGDPPDRLQHPLGMKWKYTPLTDALVIVVFAVVAVALLAWQCYTGWYVSVHSTLLRRPRERQLLLPALQATAPGDDKREPISLYPRIEATLDQDRRDATAVRWEAKTGTVTLPI